MRPDTSVGDIAALLLAHKISAVPVIDDDGHVVGIVSEGDLLGQPPSGSPPALWLRLFNEGAICLQGIATARHLKAHDVMTKRVVAVVDQTPVVVLATFNLPRIEFAYNTVPCSTNPLGIKSAGDAGSVGAPPALVNAVVDVLAELGIEHLDMPLTPERPWRAIHDAEQRKAA